MRKSEINFSDCLKIYFLPTFALLSQSPNCCLWYLNCYPNLTMTVSSELFCLAFNGYHSSSLKTQMKTNSISFAFLELATIPFLFIAQLSLFNSFSFFLFIPYFYLFAVLSNDFIVLPFYISYIPEYLTIKSTFNGSLYKTLSSQLQQAIDFQTNQFIRI